MFYIIVILAAVFAMPAKANETLKLRAVQHTTWVQTQRVGDVNNHVVGALRQTGIVFNSDGSVAGTVLVIGTFDAVIGVDGTANGYGITTFTDGSEMRSKYTATIKYPNGPTGKLLQKGTFILTGVKGRYAGVQGGGTYEGEQTQASTQPGEAIAYIDSVTDIKK
jgi:hypothetical protein